MHTGFNVDSRLPEALRRARNKRGLGNEKNPSPIGNIENLSYHFASKLLDTTSDDLNKALEIVKRVWQERNGGRNGERNPDEAGCEGVRPSPEESFRASGGPNAPASPTSPSAEARGPVSWNESFDRTPRGPSSREPNKSTVNAQTLKSLTLFDTYLFDSRPIGDVRRGELKNYTKLGKLAEAILNFGEAPDDFKVRDILKVNDLRKILLAVGEVN